MHGTPYVRTFILPHAPSDVFLVRPVLEGGRMETIQNSTSPPAAKKPLIHRWDTQTRSNRCGAPGHTGSTKHDRAVTCDACLESLGRSPQLPPTAVRH
jgi:hypothetical protein